jgi:hypothetical protein
MSDKYDKDYYENGIVKGISGYVNYSWMPELTFPMAFHLIKSLNLSNTEKVLDYGCAKGFLVKALRLFGIDAYGVDISSYAISQVDPNIKEYCKQINDCNDLEIFNQNYEFMIAKDVFEHLSVSDLNTLLKNCKKNIKNIFVAIPLAEDDSAGKYIVPEYDKDITHLIAKSSDWWKSFFEENGWHVRYFSNVFPGLKENWTSQYPLGNGFFILSSKQ